MLSLKDLFVGQNDVCFSDWLFGMAANPSYDPKVWLQTGPLTAFQYKSLPQAPAVGDAIVSRVVQAHNQTTKAERKQMSVSYVG